jgi:hypothetical protein
VVTLHEHQGTGSAFPRNIMAAAAPLSFPVQFCCLDEKERTEEKRCATWGTREVNPCLLAPEPCGNCFLSRSFSSFFRLQAPQCVLFRYQHGPNILSRALGPVREQDGLRGPPGMWLRGLRGGLVSECHARWGQECGSSVGQGELSMPRGEIRFRLLTGPHSSSHPRVPCCFPPHVTVQCGAMGDGSRGLARARAVILSRG